MGWKNFKLTKKPRAQEGAIEMGFKWHKNEYKNKGFIYLQARVTRLGEFFNIWLLFTWVFLKFYLNKQFQNTVCCTYSKIQKHFDATIFDFQFELL